MRKCVQNPGRAGTVTTPLTSGLRSSIPSVFSNTSTSNLALGHASRIDLITGVESSTSPIRKGITTNIRRGAFIFVLCLYSIQLHALTASDNNYKKPCLAAPHTERLHLPNLYAIAHSLFCVTHGGFSALQVLHGTWACIQSSRTLASSHGRSCSLCQSIYCLLMVCLRCRMRTLAHSNHQIWIV